MKTCLTVGDLPPGGVNKNFYKETEQMIEFHIWYAGYPEKDIGWITFFFIDPTHQSSGYGQEVIHSFLSLAREAGFPKFQLAVAKKKLASPPLLDKARI